MRKLVDTDELYCDREVQSAPGFPHPAMLSVIGCTRFCDRPIIPLPFMEGSLQTVVDHLASGKPPGRWTFTAKMIILCRVAVGVQALHTLGLVHRDLTPGNILLEDHEPRIAGVSCPGCATDRQAPGSPRRFRRPRSQSSAAIIGVPRGLSAATPPDDSDDSGLSPLARELLSRRPHDAPSRISAYLTRTAPTVISDFLGHGGTSFISLEYHPSHHREVTVKRFQPHSFRRGDMIREIEALAKLNHPCVVRMLGWSFPDGNSMAEIQTEPTTSSLAKLLTDERNGEFSETWTSTRKAIVIAGLVLGLRYVHSCKIMHRNLMPVNILIDRDGYPLIANFEHSWTVSEPGTLTVGGGNVYYAAPETFDSPPHTTAVDVFSFASILFEIVAGEPAFALSRFPLPVLKKVTTGQMPAVPDKCGDFFQKLIRECWSLDPANRPTFKDILERLDEKGFDVLPGADVSVVREYVTAVREWEGEVSGSADDPGRQSSGRKTHSTNR
jgi:serine/threonine protein kinase